MYDLIDYFQQQIYDKNLKSNHTNVSEYTPICRMAHQIKKY